MKLRRERFGRRNGSGKNSQSSSSWMVTFTDLITLILVFFILLFSMSQIDLQKFKAAVDSIQKEGNGLQPDQTSIEKRIHPHLIRRSKRISRISFSRK